MLSFSPDNSVSFGIDFDRFDCEDFATGAGRWVYRTTITVDGNEVFSEADLRCGTTTQDEPARLGEMLATFLVFLSACAEASDGGENADLFPEATRKLAQWIGADKLGMWADEIDPKH